ncbi:MAG: hypothetical protein SH818_19050 [Saprospiraceae bacterium]|nr:hypothetical protein [Saprospiraceae bacterium]
MKSGICFFVAVLGYSILMAQSSNRGTLVTIEPEGPSNIRIELNSLIKSEFDFQFDYFDFLNVTGRVYEDKNPKSGIYYFLPKQYYLEWTPENGYNFHINYLSTGKGIIITGRLLPNISQQQLDLVEMLVENEVRKDIKLQSMPVSTECKLIFSGAWGSLFDPKSLEVKVPANFLEPLTFALRANDAIDVANICNFLFGDNGIKGEMMITPSGSAPAEPISVILKLDDRKTFGTAELTKDNWRNNTWQNIYPYPIIVKNLHLLRIVNKKPTVYTWQMGDVEIAEATKIKFDAGLVPDWIDRDLKTNKIWIDYVVKKCKECDNEIIERLTKGTGGSVLKPMTIEILDPIAYTGAAKIKIQVQSFQLDPNGRTKILKDPINIIEDGGTIKDIQLYVPVGKNPQFEYTILLIMPDGKSYDSGWQKNNGANIIVFGREQIKAIFPDFPKK